MVDGKKEGFGIYETEKDIYEGQWCEDKKFGCGTLLVKNLFHISGEWKNNILIKYIRINTKFNDSIYDLTPIIYFGKGYIVEKLITDEGHQYLFNISPKSFFQTNTKQGEVLYNKN